MVITFVYIFHILKCNNDYGIKVVNPTDKWYLNSIHEEIFHR